MFRKRPKEEIIKYFCQYCQEVNYGEVKVQIAKGTPVKIIEGIKEIRFDIEKVDK